MWLDTRVSAFTFSLQGTKYQSLIRVSLIVYPSFCCSAFISACSFSTCSRCFCNIRLVSKLGILKHRLLYLGRRGCMHGSATMTLWRIDVLGRRLSRTPNVSLKDFGAVYIQYINQTWSSSSYSTTPTILQRGTRVFCMESSRWRSSQPSRSWMML